jgi:hypothetical protein
VGPARGHGRLHLIGSVAPPRLDANVCHRGEPSLRGKSGAGTTLPRTAPLPRHFPSRRRG